MTARQQLLQRVTQRLTANTVRALLQENGKVYTETFGSETYTVDYQIIEPASMRMNEIVEGVAKDIGGKVWKYYLDMSDLAYRRFCVAAYRSS